jgi:hypothetical protein
MTFGAAIVWILFLVNLFLTGFAAVIAVMAFADCLRRPANMFPIMGKRTKNFWLIITGIAGVITVLSVWGMISPLVGAGPSAISGVGIFQLIAAIAAGIYLADVKKAVS